MLSNDVTAGELVPALLLTPKGRLIAPVRMWRRGPEDFLLLTEPELGDVVRATLLRSRFAVEVRDRARAAHLVGRFRRERGLPGEIPGTVEVLDATVPGTAGNDELERARIEAGVPAWGRELDDAILPAEAGLDETHISFTKGCYPGQEPVARLRHRGHVNRRLRVLEVESAAARRRDRVRGQAGRPGDERGFRICPRLRASRGSRWSPGHGRRQRRAATLTGPSARSSGDRALPCGGRGRTFESCRAHLMRGSQPGWPSLRYRPCRWSLPGLPRRRPRRRSPPPAATRPGSPRSPPTCARPTASTSTPSTPAAARPRWCWCTSRPRTSAAGFRTSRL